MTREELKIHCEKQIEACEMWAKHKGEEPHGKVYEEHKLILELLEQHPCEDAISRADIKKYLSAPNENGERVIYESDLDLLPPISPQSKWTLCSERLPTKEECIANNGLFIVSDGNRTYSEYFDVYSSMKYFGEPTMSGFRVDRCVIAWMSLPKPYDSQESEDEGMTRLEEHRAVIDELYKKAEEKPKGTYGEMVIFQLSAIATALVDISKSLVIIADRVESEVQG